jgi:hypothetical protein
LYINPKVSFRQGGLKGMPINFLFKGVTDQVAGFASKGHIAVSSILMCSLE